MNQNDVREHSDVIGACGNVLGKVDRVEGGSIKLTRESTGDGQHHYIPLNWIDYVDEHVHLKKDCEEARKQWHAAPMSTSA